LPGVSVALFCCRAVSLDVRLGHPSGIVRGAHRVTAFRRPSEGLRRFADWHRRRFGEAPAILWLAGEGRSSPVRRGACGRAGARRLHAI
jgi:hypothetical protein